MEDGRQKTDNRRRKTEDRTLRSEAPMRTTRRRALFSVLCLLPSLFFVLAACGKKGPPLAPLNMAPEAPQTITARRLGGTVYLQMTVPAKSTLGKGPFSDDHLEVYAVTLAPGAILPANRDLLKPEHVIAKIEIQPPADPDAPPPDTPDTRPRPGTVITFVETLTEAALTPQVITLPPKPEKHPKTPPVTPPPSTVPAASAVPPPPAGPLVLTRMYD